MLINGGIVHVFHLAGVLRFVNVGISKYICKIITLINTNMNVSVTRAITDTYTIAVKNIPSVLGAAILWILTCWIPYINVGTTIALFYGMPLELSRGGVMNPLSIFDAKYRKYMGEFFACVGLMFVSLLPAYFFMIVPGIIISIGWMFAVLLLVDKEMSPTTAMSMSTKYTYGYKWTIFLSQLVIYIALFFIYLIIGWILAKIDVGFISFIGFLALFGLTISLGVAFNGAMYRMLVLERDEPLPTDVD